MKITPDNQKLFALVESARNKQIILPEFQRSFVWPYVDVKDLLISIFKGFYIGSLLLLDADNTSLPFAYRVIEGVNGTANDDQVQKYILDGQQRITTLHYVLYAPDNVNLKYTSSPYKFFLYLDKFMEDDLESAITAYRKQDCIRLTENTIQQFTKKIIPFTSLTQKSWQDWQLEYVETAENDALKAERALETIKWGDKLQDFFNFQTTIMTMGKVGDDDNEGISEICTIFEKINSKGVKLTVFDLLTARLTRSNISLRNMWLDAYQTSNNISTFSDEDPGIYAIFVLRIIGLIRGIDVKASNLINLSPINFLQDFGRAILALDSALNKIKSTHGYGVFDKKWLPYPSMVATLAALIDLTNNENLDANATKVINKWYWGSVFAERYQSGVESTTARDFRDIRDYLMGDKAESVVLVEIGKVLTQDNLINKLNITNNARSSVYRGVMCLTEINGAQDFRTDEAIALHTLDDHHIFPKDYLANHFTSEIPLTDSQMNCILNKTLISDRTNRMISYKAPSDYINEPLIIDQTQKTRILRKHFISSAGIVSMNNNDFKVFQEERSKKIIEVILKKISE